MYKYIALALLILVGTSSAFIIANIRKKKAEMAAVIQMATYYADSQYEKAADYADAIDPVGKQKNYQILLAHVRKAFALQMFAKAQAELKTGRSGEAENDFGVAKFYAKASELPDAFPDWAKKLEKEVTKASTGKP